MMADLFTTTHPDPVTGRSQAGQILAHLQSGASLTALDALHLFGCNRLAARIADLRAKGYRVRSTLIEVANGKHVSSYTLLDYTAPTPDPARLPGDHHG